MERPCRCLSTPRYRQRFTAFRLFGASFASTVKSIYQKPGNHPNCRREKAISGATLGTLGCSESNSLNCTHTTSHAKTQFSVQLPETGWKSHKEVSCQPFSLNSRSFLFKHCCIGAMQLVIVSKMRCVSSVLRTASQKTREKIFSED